MTIVMTTDVRGFFGEAVQSALRTHQVEASTGAREYLVALLADLAFREPRVEGAPLSLRLGEAMNAPREERLEKLKDVGDASLCTSGLFAEHLEARGVDPGYVVRVGATAYGAAAGLLGAGDGHGPGIFTELADHFARFVTVLRDVADGLFSAVGPDATSLVKLYERWQRTGSPRAGEALVARGLVPIRGGGLS